VALISVGIDHEHASMDLLERASVGEHEWSKVLRTLVSHRNVHEAVFVSTCLRTEVVAVIDLFHGAVEDITLTLAEVTGLAREEFQDRLSVHFDRGVVTHLFAVAAGLKSVVPGEFEVLGQLRRALELAEEEQTAGAQLVELFHRALASGRRVRAETSIARGTTSFARTAVEMAGQELGSELTGAHAVVVGAGQLATGVVKSLLALETRLGSLSLVNRSVERAEALRRAVDDPRVEVRGIEELSQALGRARLAVVAVEVPAPVVTAGHVAESTRPLLFVDLGVPRAVAADVAGLEHVRRVDIGDLRERIELALDGRQEAMAEAHELVRADVDHFLSDQRARGAAGIVSELREHLDRVVEAELVRRERDLGGFSAEQRELVRSLLRSVVAKVAHRPTVALKEAAGTDQGLRLSEATRHLFDL
jgi:glutamyl-tRNA reductase